MQRFMAWLHDLMFRPTRQLTLFLGFMAVVWAVIHAGLLLSNLEVGHPLWSAGVFVVGFAQLVVGYSEKTWFQVESAVNTAAAGLWSYLTSAAAMIELSTLQLPIVLLFAVASIFVTLRLKYQSTYRSHCMAE